MRLGEFKKSSSSGEKKKFRKSGERLLGGRAESTVVWPRSTVFGSEEWIQQSRCTRGCLEGQVGMVVCMVVCMQMWIAEQIRADEQSAGRSKSRAAGQS